MIDAEGVALELSAEIVRTTATGLLFLLAAYWIVYVLQRSWRQVLWEEGVHRWRELAPVLDGEIRVRGFGWRIKGKQGVLDVRGGVFPVRTKLRIKGRKAEVVAGIADVDWVTARLGGSPARSSDGPSPPRHGSEGDPGPR